MDNAIRDLGREIAIRNRRERARQAIDDEAAQIILDGKRDGLVLSDIAKRLNEAGKKTSSGKDFGKIQVLRAWQMLQADGDTDNVDADDANGLAVKDTNEVTEQQVDIEAEILRSKLVAQLKAENAELKAERDKQKTLVSEYRADTIKLINERNELKAQMERHEENILEFADHDKEQEFLKDELQAQVDSLTKQLDTVKAERDKVNESLAEFVKSNAELGKLVSELQIELETSKSATKRLREENEELLAEIEPLREQLANAKSHAVIAPNNDALRGKLEAVLKPFQELIANNPNPNQPRLKKMVEIVKAIEGIL